ncbi:mechanosensitive ion channel [Kamptonema sp. UHCC 0994]|uniref:mechanosensitive ion channel n=1 Tax=Kamptonema sp. UHCC 0994 TaxID=3031329 RepID=UPI0023B8D6AB|nr:mechanosensitive ion channel [Kamptonema sp. UHCC 0994]MDF0554986.1 mechanosensitive ion channel [Kamptonema sp. UHCC 0994]
MNGTWQEITQGTNILKPVLSGLILGQQMPVLPNPLRVLPPEFNPIIDLALAIGILVIGYVIALIAEFLTKKLLDSTDIDNRVAGWIGGQQGGTEMPPVDKWIASAVFWLVMIFALVGFLDKLQLTAASQPLASLLNQITVFLPKVLGAAGLLAVAWLLATISKLVVTRGLRLFRLDERLNQQVAGTPAQNQLALSDTLANALYWFIFLLFLPSVLSTLELEGTLQPVQRLLDDILSILPNVLAAVFIGATGWLIAQIVRRIVTNLLAATGTDLLGARVGLTQSRGGQTLSWIVGTIVYVLILIPTAIAALNALRVEAISAPAVSMLTQILNAIPQIFTAGVILAIAYFIGRFIADLVANILTGIGFNNIFYWLGLQSRPNLTVAPPTINSLDPDATVLQPDATAIPSRTPSEIAGIVALVGIMLFATVTATDVLNLDALTSIVNQIIVISGRVLIGLIVFAIGLYLANLAYNLIASSGTRQARLLAQTARISIIALVSAMALQQMGIASNIVNLAFGLLLGAIAVAIALAFGLGSRDIAAEQVREWLAEFKEQKPPQS